MSIDNVDKRLFDNVEDIDILQKIVEELLNTDNLDRKTELQKPLIWSTMAILKDHLKDKGLKKSSHILESFEQISFRYLISKNREGRKEYIKALESISTMKKQQDISNEERKLLG